MSIGDSIVLDEMFVGRRVLLAGKCAPIYLGCTGVVERVLQIHDVEGHAMGRPTFVIRIDEGEGPMVGGRRVDKVWVHAEDLDVLDQ